LHRLSDIMASARLLFTWLAGGNSGVAVWRLPVCGRVPRGSPADPRQQVLRRDVSGGTVQADVGFLLLCGRETIRQSFDGFRSASFAFKKETQRNRLADVSSFLREGRYEVSPDILFEKEETKYVPSIALPCRIRFSK